MPYQSSATRREFIAFGVALAAGAGCSEMENPAEQPVTSSPLIDLSAGEGVAAMQRGDITAEAYADALLEQCSKWQHLNAFINLDPEAVREAARAADVARASGAALPPLHGLPIPVKDSVNTIDYPTTGGTPALRNFTPADDAELVRRLRQAGAIVMGKTNIHELSFGWTSNNLAFGAVRNPYDTSRIPGGSSGGTAAAVAGRCTWPRTRREHTSPGDNAVTTAAHRRPSQALWYHTSEHDRKPPGARRWPSG